jgi:hypothetical protein
LEHLPPEIRGHVRGVLEKPTLSTRGTTEVFHGSLSLYQWFLDHPDQAVFIWRRLGAKCSDITDSGSGWFRWKDGQGSEISWETVQRGPGVRVWYAQGKIHPGLLLPDVPVRAVVVLNFAEGQDETGRPVLRHQAELVFHTDSKAAALIAKLLGPAAPHLAEQCVGQIELFFSALVWYLDRHPEKAWALLWGGPPGAGVHPSK